MSTETSKIVIGKQGERWRVTSCKVPITNKEGVVEYRDCDKMDLLDDVKGKVSLPIDLSDDRKVNIYEITEPCDEFCDFKTYTPLPGSIIPPSHKEMKIVPTEDPEEKHRPPPIHYGALNDVWKSTGSRSRHYDPMPEVPYDTDLTGNRQAQEWAFNVLPLSAEQKEEFLKTLVADQARIDNLKARQLAMPKLPSKRKVESILDYEINKNNKKGRKGVKTIVK